MSAPEEGHRTLPLEVVPHKGCVAEQDDIEEPGHLHLEGSVRKAGNRIRITAQLISVADSYHLWSERYEREMADVFDIQGEISQAIGDRLHIELVGERPLVKRYTENLAE